MAGGAHIGWIDAVRALGACSIVLLHVLVSTNIACDLSLARSCAYAVVGIVCARWAVPGFFMISGYLLLDPARPLGWRKASRHAWRMVVALATFGLAFAVMQEAYPQVVRGSVDVREVVARSAADVLLAATWDHLWYVYTLAGIYLLAPLVRRVASWGQGRGLPVVTGVLACAGLVVPTVWQAMGEAGVAPVPYPSGAVATYLANLVAGLACFCVGGCLRSVRRGGACMVAGSLSLALMLGVSLWGLVSGRGDQGYVFLQSSVFSCLYAAGVLTCLRTMVGDDPLAEEGPAAALARDSFGIYLVHPLFIHLVLLVAGPPPMPPVLYEVAFSLLVLAASVATTRVLRHVPVVGSVL